MNLKTHTCYPEIMVSEPDSEGIFSWIARLLGGSGEVAKEFTGTANSRQACTEAAQAEIQACADEYVKPTPPELKIIT